MRTARLSTATTAALLLGALPLIACHGDETMDMNMGGAGGAPSNMSAYEAPDNYFRHPYYGGWMVAHIVLMTVAWCIVMPVALMLSVARSRYHLPSQVALHTLNGLGCFTSFVYNHSTPNLYKGNAHSPIGWVATSFTIAWTLMSLFVAYGEYKSKRRSAGGHSITSRAMAQHNRFFHRYRDSLGSRSSRDSAHGSSLLGSRQHSQDSMEQKPVADAESPVPEDHDDDDTQSEKNGLLGNNRVDRFIARHVRRFSTPRASKITRFCQIVLEKFLLLLGFAALTTGFVVYGGLFRGKEIFSGLAHFIKGGIFFWYGLLTLGRWMGAFTEFGWAWNVRPEHPTVSRWKTRVPSAEFTESFVIWLYGASNVFLERFNANGRGWSHQDLEHVSITLLFFGGGLLGMMIESPWARKMINTTVEIQQSREEEVGGASRSFDASGAVEEPDQLYVQPRTYRTSLNPLPALVIMFLGIMMSGHHQNSMVSTMMHAQWGTLFTGFSLARGVTYIILYIKPPTSRYPARPPSELVAAFCLTAGGIMFMMSARDSVTTIETNGLDAMSIFTVTMGLSAAILAWEVVVFAVKGWAVRKERAAAGRPIS